MRESNTEGGGGPDFIDGLREVAAAQPGFVERYSPAFMARHTPFPTFRAMAEASGLGITSDAELERALPTPEWDAFVRDTTEFASWLEMERAAVDEAVADRGEPG